MPVTLQYSLTLCDLYNIWDYISLLYQLACIWCQVVSCVLSLAQKMHVSHPQTMETQFKPFFSYKSHIISAIYLCELFFTSKLNLYLLCSCATFRKQQRKNIYELLLFLYTMHFNCWVNKKYKKSPAIQLNTPTLYVGSSCIISPINHHTSLWLQASPHNSWHSVVDKVTLSLHAILHLNYYMVIELKKGLSKRSESWRKKFPWQIWFGDVWLFIGCLRV